MKKWKQRLVTLLIACLLAPMFLVSVPQLQTETQAASKKYIMWDGIANYKALHPTTTGKCVIEQGQKFDMSDWIDVSYYSNNNYVSTTAHGMKMKWTSDKKAIVSVTNKGIVNTKKTGTAKLTVKVNGQKLTCDVKVVKKGSLTKKIKNGKKANEALAKIVKYSDVKLTDKVLKEEYALLKNIYSITGGDSYSTYNKENPKIKHNYGLVYEKNKYTTNKNEMAMPHYGTYRRIRQNVTKAIKDAPKLTASQALVLSGEGQSGTTTLTAPVTVAQFLRIMYQSEYLYDGNLGGYPGRSEFFEFGQSTVSVGVKPSGSSILTYVDLTVTPGKNTLSVKAGNVSLNTGTYTFNQEILNKIPVTVK